MIKVTMYFNSNAEPAGWSESWYSAANNPANGFDNIDAIITARSKLLSTACELVAIRSSSLAPPGFPRQSLLRKMTQSKVGLRTGSYNEIGDCLQVTARGNASPNVVRAYRGIPDDWASDGKTQAFAAEIRKLVGAYYTAVKANLLGDRIISPTGFFPVSLLERNHTSLKITLNVQAGHGVVPGEVIVVRGFRGLTPTFSGQKRVVDVTATTLEIRPRSIPDGLVYGNMEFSKVVPALAVPIEISDVDIGHRNTGRPFGLRRGRRPAR